MFFKIDVLKNFAIFTGKHVLESLFSEVAGLGNRIRKSGAAVRRCSSKKVLDLQLY